MNTNDMPATRLEAHADGVTIPDVMAVTATLSSRDGSTMGGRVVYRVDWGGGLEIQRIIGNRIVSKMRYGLGDVLELLEQHNLKTPVVLP